MVPVKASAVTATLRRKVGRRQLPSRFQWRLCHVPICKHRLKVYAVDTTAVGELEENESTKDGNSEMGMADIKQRSCDCVSPICRATLPLPTAPERIPLS